MSARIDSRRRTAVFRLRAAGRARGFQCSLVRRSGRAGSGFPHSRYRRCPATVIYRHLRTGTYRFSARAFGPGGIQRIPLIVVFNVVAGHPGTPAKGRR